MYLASFLNGSPGNPSPSNYISNSLKYELLLNWPVISSPPEIPILLIYVPLSHNWNPRITFLLFSEQVQSKLPARLTSLKPSQGLFPSSEQEDVTPPLAPPHCVQSKLVVGSEIHCGVSLWMLTSPLPAKAMLAQWTSPSHPRDGAQLCPESRWGSLDRMITDVMSFTVSSPCPDATSHAWPPAGPATGLSVGRHTAAYLWRGLREERQPSPSASCPSWAARGPSWSRW